MKNFLVVTILVVLQCYTFGQELKIDSVFISFRSQVIQSETEGKGFIKWDENMESSLNLLLAYCPLDSLMNYVGDTNTAVSSFIFQGMACSNQVELETLQKIAKKYESRSSTFSIDNGDFQQTWRINDFMNYYISAYPDIKKVDYKALLK